MSSGFAVEEAAAGTRIIYINKNATGSGSGSSWANAAHELSFVISDPDFVLGPTNKIEFWMAKGTYRPAPASNRDRTSTFQLRSHMRILGGFKGTETDPSQRLLFGYPTVLSGDINTPQANGITDQNAENPPPLTNPGDSTLQDNCYNVVTATNVTDVVLDQVYIANGCAFSNGVSGDYIAGMVQPLDSSSIGEPLVGMDPVVAGAGLYFNYLHDRPATNADLILNNCTFLNNAAIGYGGGATMREGNIDVTYCHFKNNFAAEAGGGAFVQNCRFAFIGCDFNGDKSEGAGGALQVETLSSDKTIPALGDPTDFKTVTGMDPNDLRKYSGYAIAASKLLPKLVSSFSAAYQAGNSALDVIGRTVRGAMPRSPIPESLGGNAVDEFSGEEIGAVDRFAGAYAYVTIAISVVDLGIQIAAWTGGDTNNAFVRGWSVFSTGFNTYATPQGLLTLLSQGIITGLGKLTDVNPDYIYDQAREIKKTQIFVYNQQDPSTVLQCTFENNFAGSAGGAMDCTYDNVQIEGCSFTGNICSGSGGALSLNSWTTPKVISCTFYQNISTNGESAIINFGHARSQIINSTFYQNQSISSNGVAIGVVQGSEVSLYNSILWGNTNPSQTNGGADLMVSTKALLSVDPKVLAEYNKAGPSYGDFVGICDVANSCVQSLHQLPLGTDRINLFPYSQAIHYTQQDAAEIVQQKAAAENQGPLVSFGFINVGEGIRPTLLDADKKNTDADPLLDGNLRPSAFSPAVDTGSSLRLTNGANYTITGEDINQNDRIVGAQVDMGAVENQKGFNPSDIVYVRPTATGNGSGSGWNNATADLQTAISTTGPHQVWVAAGTYYPTSGTNRAASFSLANEVVVYGGFAGTETNLTQRNWQAHQSILSGDIGTHGNDSDNSYHIMFNNNNGIDSRTLLDGFYFTKGRATDTVGGFPGVGGAIFNYKATPTIQNCVFMDNQANNLGGAIYSYGVEGSPITSCLFTNNVSGAAGGAVYYDGSRLWMKLCQFQKNTSASGGGLSVSGTDVGYIYDCLFASNSVSGAQAIGGGLQSSNTDLRVYNSTFTQNSVNAANSRGGGALDVYGYNKNLGSLQNCIFWHNTATNTGGASPSLEFQQLSSFSYGTATTYVDHCLIEGLDKYAGSITSSNFDADPQFTNFAGGNFRLTKASPAIDAGVNLTGYGFPVLDLDGNTRLANTGMDLGAYEYQGVPVKASFQLTISESCDGTGAIYTAQLNGTNSAATGYQWQVNKNDGAGWANIADGGVYFGTTTTNLTVIHPPVSLNGYRYRLSISLQGVTFTSTAGTLNVSRTLLYVRANATGANDGSSWGNAYTDLQTALNNAASCSQIWVASGTYVPGTIANSAYRLKQNVSVYGGFAGTETNLAQRNWRANVATLSGNGSLQTILYNDGHQIGSANDASAILDGFTLSGATNSAMVLYACSPIIRNCTFVNNSGPNGGALNIGSGASPTLVNCTFTGNLSGEGGAIYCTDSSPKFVNCLIYGNRSNYRGAGVDSFRSALQMINCTITGNTASQVGGGIYQQNGTNLIVNSILWGNQDGNINGTLASRQATLDGGGAQTLQSCDVQGLTNSGLYYDPLFADTGVDNYRLSAFSPLINAGNNTFTNGISTDADGNARVVGAVVDLGAYEYQTPPSNAIYVLRAPQSVELCDISQPAVFTIQGTNAATNFQWQVNSGSGFAAVPATTNYAIVISGNTSTLTVTGISNSMNGWQFRATIGVGGAATPPATLILHTPTIIYVNASQSGGTHDGTSWFHAFNDLQSALAVADTCSEIWVVRGTYTPVLTNGVSSYRLISGVGVYGGFLGFETNRTQRDWVANVTALSANTNGSIIVANDAYYGGAIDNSAVLDGFTFTNIATSAVRNWYGNPTIRNCFFTGNGSYSIINDTSSAIISSCTFSNNTGIPVYNRGGTPTISGCTFVNNNVDSFSGGIFNQGGAPVVSQCSFSGNTADWGGAVYNSSSANLALSQCVFLNNSSGGGGAVYNAESSTASLKNSLFNGNSSPNFRGGAIAHYGSSMLVENCTLVNNFALISGGGIYDQGDNLMVKNSILWGNYLSGQWTSGSPDLMQIDNGGSSSIQVMYSDVQGLATYAGNSNIGYDPLFANAPASDFTLTSYSPAIDSGLNDADVAGPDLSGHTRVFGASVDLGTYERQSAGAGVLRFLSSPTPQTACAGNTVQFTITGSLTNSYTYQWQQLVAGNFVNVGTGVIVSNSGNASILTATNLSVSQNGTIFRFVVNGTSYASSNLTLTVNAPRIVYVKPSNGVTGTGTSWTTAYTNLQTAINDADSCAEIWAAQGDYYLTNSSGAYSLQMKEGVRIYGGFLGTESQRTQRNWTNNPTVLHAVSTLPVIDNEGNIYPLDASSILDGFTISGHGTYAIWNQSSSPTYQNCTIINTNGTGVGTTERSTPVFANCVFTNNFGAAMSSNPRSSPIVMGSLFINNKSSFRGGAIYNGDGNLQLIDCRFTNNVCTREPGGAVCQEGSGQLTCTRCIFSGNGANEGGAMYLLNSHVTMVDCLFVGNVATNSRAGAIDAAGTQLVMNNCTMIQNSAGYLGGGIFINQGTLGATNSIFWFNVDHAPYSTSEQQQINGINQTVNLVDCSVQGLSQYAGPGNVPYDPLFANINSNDFSLSLVSPLVNAGNNAATNLSSLDLAGNPRVIATNVDIGAFERQTVTNLAPLRLVTGPASLTVCAGNNAVFPLIGDSNGTLSVTWQINSGSGFTNVVPSAIYVLSTNTFSSVLTVSNTLASQNGFQFRYLAGGGTFASVPVTLSVNPRAVIFVNAANSNPTQTGTGWSTAFTNLQTALASADGCSEIWVAKGAYTPGYYLGYNSYTLTRGSQLYGGFAGNETNRTQRNWTNNPVVLLGNGQGAVIYNDGTAVPVDGTTVMDGFTITSTNNQSGMFNYIASPTIRNCTFANNAGYGLDVIDGNPLVDSCRFISNHFASVDIRSGAAPTFSNCLFTNNSTVQGNVQIYDQSTPVLTNCLFVNNTDTTFGAGLYVSSASFTLASCRFTGNVASSGPCLEMSSSTGVLVNSLMASNTGSFRAGAIEEAQSSLRIINSTIARNTGANYAGGILSYQSTNIVLNSIFWDNLDSDIAPTLTSRQIYLESATDLMLLTNSCVEGSTNASAGNVVYNPLFVDEANGNYAIGPNSPAVNAGNNSFIAGYNTDLAGNSRVQLTNVDLGCYESATVQAPLYLQGTPGSQSHCVGDVAIFTFTVSNISPSSLFWLYNTGGNWAGFAGTGPQLFGPPLGTYTLSNSATSTSLIVSNVVAGMNAYRFEVATINSSFVSTPVSLFVNSGSTIYVNANALPGGDGTTWATAYSSLQVALANASVCRPIIWVAKGTYYPTATTNQNTAFELVAGTSLLGGFAGTETNSNQRNWTANPVILSGDIGVPGNPSDNSSVVVAAHGASQAMGTNTIFDGFIIEQGTNGGMVVDTASPTIQNCIIRSNYQSGLYFLNTTSLVQNCTITGNIGSFAGGLAAFSSSPIIKNCVISGNTGLTGGGGMYFQEGGPQVLNSLITGNKGVNGGGISRVTASGTLSIVNCTISGNSASFTSGGGVFGGPGLTLIDSSILWGNTATGPISQQSQFNTSSGGTSNIFNSCVQNFAFTPFNAGNSGDDPLFLAPLPASSAPIAGGDFHVETCSPVIDAGNFAGLSGISGGTINKDLDGLPRYHGTIDIGCYEFQTNASPALRVTLQPVSFTNCSSGNNGFQITAAGSGLSYQWQADLQDGQGFVPLSDNSIFSGTATATLAFNNASYSLNQSQFRCLVNSASGCSVLSQAATLTVNPPHLYVSASAPANGDGVSWATAYQTLQQALSSPILSKCSGEIWVAAGKYYPSYSNSPTQALAMKSHLAIYGGFNGTENFLYQRNWALNQTIISGDIGVAGDHSDDSHLLIGNNGTLFVAIDNSARLDGFILEYGTGGILNITNATPTIAHCVFRHFSSSAINNQSISSAQRPIIEDCSFLNNGNSGGGGGGIYNDAASPLILRCEFRGNIGSTGGGMDSEDNSFPTIQDCIFSGNTATTGGGSYSSSVCNLNFVNCTFAGNSASGSAGGFYASSVGFTNCVFWKNKDSSGYTQDAQYTTTLGGIQGNHCDVQSLLFLNQNISSDPLFVLGIDGANAPTTNGDFHVGTCSPIINAGYNPVATDLTDFDGNDRILDGTVDMGAYEDTRTQLGFSIQPTDQTGGPTNSVQFSAVPNLDGCTFQWQVNRGSGFVNATNGSNYSGVTTSILTFTNITLAAHSNQFRCVIQSPAGCQAVSLAAAFHYLPPGGPPSVLGTPSVSIVESSTNTISVYTAVSPDNLTNTFSLAGTDAALLRINSGGALSFRAPPSFGAPGDADHDNIYNVTVITTDQVGQTGVLAVAIQVLYDYNKVYFLTLPVTNATVGSFYKYEFLATGPHPSNIVYTAPTLPAWLQIATNPSVVTTVAGNGTPGSADGVSTNATFNNPQNMVVDANGNVIVADETSQALRKIVPDGTVTTFPAYVGYTSDVAMDAAGNFYVASITDSDNEIMKVTPDGSNSVSLVTVPTIGRLAVDASGTNIYFTGSQHAIYRYQSGTGVTVFAGSETTGGLRDGTGTNALFLYPRGLAVDGSGNIYVADWYNHAVRVITPAGAVTTLAGGYGQGYRDGISTNAYFNYPYSVTVDGSGMVYVGDFGNNMVRQIAPSGLVTTLAGTIDPGSQDGPALQASFYRLNGVAANRSGSYVYVADTGNNLIRKVKTVSAAIFGTPADGNFGNSAVNLFANDGTRNTNQSFTISVIRTIPVAYSQSVSVYWNSNVSITLTGSNADGVPLNYVRLSNPSRGSVSGFPPNLVYTPVPNYVGPDSFIFNVNDGHGNNSSNATVSITVYRTNIPPVVSSQSVTNFEDTPINITLGSFDADGDILAYTITNGPAHGTLTGSAPNLVYVPATNYNGSDSFDFMVNDGVTNSGLATVSITITPVNDAPVTINTNIVVFRGQPVTLPVVLYGTDIENDPLTVAGVTQGTNGTVTFTSTNVTYNPGATGNSDSFTYQITDGNGGLATGSVSVVIFDTSLIVTTNADSGPGSLRLAIATANSSPKGPTYQITFAPGMAGQTINLSSTFISFEFGYTSLFISNNVTIDGAAASGVVVQRDVTSGPLRLFWVFAGNSFTVRNIALSGGSIAGSAGSSGYGGGGGGLGAGAAIYNEGNLTVQNIVFSNNSVRGGGGGFWGSGPAGGDGGGANGGLGGHGGNPATTGGFGSGGGGSDVTGGIGIPGLAGFGGGNGGGSIGGIGSGAGGGFGGGGGGGNASAGGGGLGAGGAIFNHAGSMIISNCTFDGNVADAGGGGLGSSSTYNGARGLGLGGSIFNYNGTVTLSGNQFLNGASDDGIDFYSLADAGTASLTFLTNALNSYQGLSTNIATAYTANVINGGVSQTIGDANTVNSHNNPWIDDIPNQTLITPVVVHFGVSSPINPGSYSVQVHSQNQSLLADSGLVLSGTGTNRTLTITPTTNSMGHVTVIATVTDGTVSIADLFHVTVPTNHAPVAVNDSASVNNGQSVNITVVQNDSDPDGDALTITSITQPTNGSAAFFVGTNVSYTHNGNAATNDSFTYVISDGRGGSATGTVSVTINHLNHDPVASNDTGAVARGGATTISVLQNDSDPDGNSLTLTGVTQPANGSVSFTTTNVTYTHNGNSSTSDSFTYSISDGHGGSATASVQITIVATFNLTVTDAGDAGPGTLRDILTTISGVAVTNAWTIGFAPALAGQTINLSTIENFDFGYTSLLINRNVTIDGSAAPGITVQRDPTGPPMRLLWVTSGNNLTLRNISLFGGSAFGDSGTSGYGGGGGGLGAGGAIYNQGNLIVQNVVLSNNFAGGGGGGYWTSGPAGGDGGGVNGGFGGHDGGPAFPGGFGSGGGGSDSSAGVGAPGFAGFGGGDGGGSKSGIGSGADGGFGGGGGGGNACGGGGGLGAGGAIFNNAGTVFIQNSVLENNLAFAGVGGTGANNGANGQGLGAAIFNYNGVVNLSSNRFLNNAATDGIDVDNLGDGSTASLTFLTNSLISFQGLSTNTPTAYAAAAVNGGFSQTVGSANIVASHNNPWVDQIPDQATMQQALIFGVSPPNNPGSYTVQAHSLNQSLLPDANLQISGSGTNRSLIITPNGQFGVVGIEITLTDGNISIADIFQQTLTPTINHSPVAADDSVSVTPGGLMLIPVLQNDYDPDGDPLTIISITQPLNGFANFTSSNVTYFNNGFPAPSDSFTYTISDGQGGLATATVNVSLHAPGLVVTSAADSGPGTLRDAINFANSNPTNSWTITFDPSVAGQTIMLSTVGYASQGNSALFINADVTIDASSAFGTSIGRNLAGPAMRLFHVLPSGRLNLINLYSLQNGLAQGQVGADGQGGGGGAAGLGGAVYNEGTFSAQSTVFQFNQASGGAGGNYINAVAYGGNGGGANGGLGANGVKVATAGGFGSGGGGGKADTGVGKNGNGGFGGGNGGGVSNSVYSSGADGGFGAGGGGGTSCGGGGGLGAGGAIFNAGGNMNLLFCTFQNNQTTIGSSGLGSTGANNGLPGQSLGGAIFNRNGLVTLQGCVIQDNPTDTGILYNLGDAFQARFDFEQAQVIGSGSPSSYNYFARAINNGQSFTTKSGSQTSQQNAPWVDDIYDLVTNANASIHFNVSAPLPNSVNYSVIATSQNPSAIPNNSLSLTHSGTDYTLTIAPPTIQIGQSSLLSIQITDGNSTMVASFNFSMANPPIIVDDVLSTDQNSPIFKFNPTVNDVPSSGTAILFVTDFATNGTRGLVTFNPGFGTFSYDPNHKFNRLQVGQTNTDSFTYSYLDTGGFSGTGRVVINISGVNDAPLAVPYTIHRFAGTNAVKIRAQDFLSHTPDPDADSVTLTGVDASSKNGGVIVPHGSYYSYLPAAGNLADSFQYTVSDNNGGFATNSVVFDVIQLPGAGIMRLEFQGGDATIGFNGVPGQTYLLQYTESVTGPWITLGAASEVASGYYYFLDPSPAGNIRIYRVLGP